MMEKTQVDRGYQSYQKKIVAYLDGSLAADEKSEFEAFVRTHPEFEAQIKSKEQELMLLRSRIPATTLSAESLSSLENEMKQSIFNLLKEEPKNFLDRVKNSWEEWTNR
jgi:anti-sigma-K factor RskA